MRISLPNNWVPMPHQEELYHTIVNGTKRRALCVWHRRAGKDSVLINATAVAAHREVGLYYYFAPTQTHARKIIWDNIDKKGRRVIEQAFPRELRASTNDQAMRIVCKNGSIFQLVGSDNYDSIVGTNPRGMVFSEWAIADKPQAWDYFRPILAENGGWAAFISTPRGMNHYYALYKQVQANDAWHVSRLTVDDTNVITHEMIQAERDSGMSEMQIQQEFYCSFAQANEDCVFDGDILAQCMARAPQDEMAAPCIVGVDVARFGDDRTVIATRIGADMQSVPIKRYGKLDNYEVAEKVAQHCRQYNVDCVFMDETGTGSGATDISKRMGLPVVGINFASSAADKSAYRNIRAEMYERFRQWSELPESALYKDCAEELMSIRYDYDPHDRIKLMDKKKIKKDLGVSPDEADAMALTFARRVPSLSRVSRPVSYLTDF